MNAQGARVLHHPILADHKTPDVEPLPSWVERRLLDLRATTMSQPTKPYWNTTMVTAWVAVLLGVATILGSVGGLYLYTRDTADKSGYERGRRDERDATRDAEIEMLKKKLEVKKLTDEANPKERPNAR